MKQDRIIERIELYYQQYWDKDSGPMCKCSTDSLISKLFEIPFCSSVLNQLMNKYPFTHEMIKDYQRTEIFNLLKDVSVNEEKYLSFCLYWLDYMKSIHPFVGYHSKCNWLSRERKNDLEQMFLFKRNVVKPIIDYLISQLKNRDNVFYIIERYKQRIELFKDDFVKECVELNIHEKDGFMTLKELELHKHLCLYLFDNDIDYHYSEKKGNGEIDFLLPQCNNSPYIIEVKVCKDECDLSRIKSGVLQLKEYMDRIETKYGCLFIYSQINYYFISDESLDKEGIQLIYAYTGDETPSTRSKIGKTVKVGFGTIECK